MKEREAIIILFAVLVDFTSQNLVTYNILNKPLLLTCINSQTQVYGDEIFAFVQILDM